MKSVILLLMVISPHARARSSDGNVDENRPYKFSFNIEGYQHRSEEKDEKGIINGEYGFVTGNGVYHVTVYATDEHGNFRIVSMKNYFIGLPNETITTGPQRPMSSPATQKQSTVHKLEGIRGCEGCLVPTSMFAPQSMRSDDRENYEIDIRYKDVKQKFSTDPQRRFKVLTQKHLPPKRTTSSHVENMLTYRQLTDNTISTTALPDVRKMLMSEKYNKSDLISAPIQTTGKQETIKTSDFYTDNLQTADTLGLAYEFNETQTYQGHYEKGFLDGSKRGNYFVNGRDGVQRLIEYVANGSGYRPRIRFQNISASETPQPDTEKLKNVLKVLYFKWFYKK